jgi:hypothetical protein
MLARLQQLLLDWLTRFPEAEEHVSRDSLKYWLRRERQSKLDLKGVVE